LSCSARFFPEVVQVSNAPERNVKIQCSTRGIWRRSIFFVRFVVVIDYDVEQQFYPRSAIQPSATLENGSRQMVRKREALMVMVSWA
jgi:hypothetical protein